MTATVSSALARLRASTAYVTKQFFRLAHSGFALLGLALAFVLLTLSIRPEIYSVGEQLLGNWLLSRKAEASGIEADASGVSRATAADPRQLPKSQAAVADWISRKYRVAPEPISALVAEAWQVGRQTGLDPTLILAIMATESSFNPFAQSQVGAQGLMQVMTRVHHDNYDNFGGRFAAFDPVSNLRVGVRVLQECITRAGSLEGGLKYYVGAANLADDGGYASKVLGEHERLKQVAVGRKVPVTQTNLIVAQPRPAAPAPALQSSLPAPLLPPLEPLRDDGVEKVALAGD